MRQKVCWAQPFRAFPKSPQVIGFFPEHMMMMTTMTMMMMMMMMMIRGITDSG